MRSVYSNKNKGFFSLHISRYQTTFETVHFNDIVEMDSHITHMYVIGIWSTIHCKIFSLIFLSLISFASHSKRSLVFVNLFSKHQSLAMPCKLLESKPRDISKLNHNAWRTLHLNITRSICFNDDCMRACIKTITNRKQ